jgi:hypothetical protein
MGRQCRCERLPKSTSLYQGPASRESPDRHGSNDRVRILARQPRPRTMQDLACTGGDRRPSSRHRHIDRDALIDCIFHRGRDDASEERCTNGPSPSRSRASLASELSRLCLVGLAPRWSLVRRKTASRLLQFMHGPESSMADGPPARRRPTVGDDSGDGGWVRSRHDDPSKNEH